MWDYENKSYNEISEMVEKRRQCYIESIREQESYWDFCRRADINSLFRARCAFLEIRYGMKSRFLNEGITMQQLEPYYRDFLKRAWFIEEPKEPDLGF